MPKSLNILAKGSLIVLGIIMALTLAEVVARQLGPPYEPGDEAHRSHQCDPLLGWRGLPNSALSVSYHDYQHEFVLNSRGMHDRERPLEKETGVFRILVMGDSMVEALEVNQSETSTQILEDRLNAQASNGLIFEVINAGVFAWGPPQPLVYFRTEGRLYQPDLIIAVWFPRNDLLDVLPDHVTTAGPEGGTHCFAPYFVMCDDQFDPRAWYTAPGITSTSQTCSTIKYMLTKWLNGIYNNSRLYQRLTALLLQVYVKDTFATHLYAPWLDFERQDSTLNHIYALTTGIYAQLATEARQLDTETVVVIAPINEAVDFEVNPARRAAMVATEPILEGSDPTLPHKVLTESLAAKGVPVLDLQPYFVEHVKAGGEPVYWSDTAIHWNVAGNRLAGESMARWLIEQNLVPSNP